MLKQLVFENYLVFATLMSYLTAQIIKTILYSLMNKKFEYKRLFGSGGMPSSHSASVASLATGCIIKHGPLSPLTAISVILAAIVIYDARGVRQETGKHAQVLNEVINNLRDTINNHQQIQFNEMAGHTFFQVVVGVAIGVIVTLLIPVF